MYSLPVLAIAGVAVPLALGQTNFALLGSYLAVPMALSSVVYLKCGLNYSKCSKFGKTLSLFSINLYLLNFIISLLILQIFRVRPFIYYVLITFMAILILFNILFFEIDKKIPLILLLEILLLLNIVWGVNLNYYFFIGRTDSIGHAWLIEDLIRQGQITDLFGIYKPFPLWHILVSSLYFVIDMHIPAHRAMFLAGGIIFSLMVPVVYLISLKIFANKRFALLGSLFVIVYSDILFYGMYSIARSVVSFLEALLILLLISRRGPQSSLLYILVIFSIILFHTASMPFLIIIFFLIWVLQKIYGTQRAIVTGNCLMLMGVSTLSYWMLFADDLFRRIISNLVSPPPSGIITKSVIYTPLNELFNYLQYSPILFLALAGILFSLRSESIKDHKRLFFLAGLLLAPLTFPGPCMLIGKLASNFNLSRFCEYSFLFIVIASSFGFGALFYRSGKYARLSLIILFIVMSFLSVSNDFVASDNPLVKRPFYTFYLTDEEITGFYRAASMAEGYLMSDFVVAKFLSYSPYKSKDNIIEVDSGSMRLLRNSSRDLILIRSCELAKRPLNLYTPANGEFELDPSMATAPDYYSQDMPLWKDLGRYNKVYESDQIAGYV